MKRAFAYILTIVICIFIGAFGMYYLMNKDPKELLSKVEKSVTVTDKGISDGIENVYDSVVVVQNYQKSRMAGIGSGFIYDEKGYIMTNHHVVEGASELKVVLMSGETIDAKLIGSDEYADIAVIQIDTKYVKAVAKIGNYEDMKVGDTVFTIGSPMNISYAGTVTRGILSGKDRMVEVSVSSNSNDYIMKVMQTDAAINPGNSGGPLCNVSGEVIGVNSMKIVQSSIEGIGFAIPIDEALNYAKQIVSGEGIKRAYLGITMSDISSTNYLRRSYGVDIDSDITSGVIVVDVDSDGPSSKSGIKKGDVIVKIGEYDVTNIAELRYYLFKHNPKDTVEVKVLRGNDEKTFKVVLGES